MPKIAYIRPLSVLFKVKEEVLLHKIYGKNSPTETELHRLKTENEHLRHRDAKREEIIRALENTIKNLSLGNPSNGEADGNSGEEGNALNINLLKKE